MKANIFLKENGLKKCSRIVEDLIEQGNDGEFVKHLKRLVESHDLVRSYKGCGKPRETALATAKFTLRHLKSTRKLEIELFGGINRELELEQAIADVESCK